MKANLPFVILWALLRFLHMYTFLALEFARVFGHEDRNNVSIVNSTCSDYLNRSSFLPDSQAKVLAWIAAIGALLAIIVDAGDLLWHILYGTKTRFVDLSGSKNLVLKLFFYRTMQGLSNCFILGGSIHFLVDNTSKPSDIPLILCPLLFSWSMMYFIQLLPFVGHYIIIMQRMLKTMMIFVAVFILMLIPFSQSFVLFVVANVGHFCVEGFQSYFETYYSMFTIILNMFDFSSIPTNNPAGLHLLHVSFTFGISILLINFLIAMMSNDVSLVNDYRHEVVAIQRLSIYFIVESRLGFLLAKYYEWQKSKIFLYKGDRVYIAAYRKKTWF